MFKHVMLLVGVIKILMVSVAVIFIGNAMADI